jgi:hypothetical protein
MLNVNVNEIIFLCYFNIVIQSLGSLGQVIYQAE